MKAYEKYLVSLMVSAVNGEEPEKKPEDVLWSDVYKLACKHSIANLVYYSVEKISDKPEAELLKKWSEVNKKAIVRDVTQRRELMLLEEEFSRAHIKMLPLKGCVMKKYYPKSDMRTMSDIDFLTEKDKIPQADAIMKSLGYTAEEQHCGHHVAYKKQPIMNVEVHNCLASKELGKANRYYADILDRVKVTEKPYVFEMTDEDFYVYIMFHHYKHYANSGAGLRHLIDVFLMLKHLEDKVDWNYIECELEKLGISEFEKDVKKLSKDIFSHNSLSDKEIEMLDYIFDSGTYGSDKNSMQNGVAKRGRLGQLLHSTFPSADVMKFRYPVLDKCILLLPFCWLARIIRLCTKDRAKMKRKTAMIINAETKSNKHI